MQQRTLRVLRHIRGNVARVPRSPVCIALGATAFLSTSVAASSDPLTSNTTEPNIQHARQLSRLGLRDKTVVPFDSGILTATTANGTMHEIYYEVGSLISFYVVVI